ncbi:MAG: ATP cone domain-containing protein [Cyanobium sp. MAG06]|nr:ATP cone domain-containing protein [Cyanobium sp. MAG06]
MITSIKKRNGIIVPFDKSKIEIAISKAFKAMTGDINNVVARNITNIVIEQLESKYEDTTIPEVEKIQDLVEIALMQGGYLDIAKHYIVYRYEHQKIRQEEKEEVLEQINDGEFFIIKRNGKKQKFDINKISKRLDIACQEFSDFEIDKEGILNQIKLEVFQGITSLELYKILVMNVRTKIEEHPVYSKIAANLLLNKLYKEVLGKNKEKTDITVRANEHFPVYIKTMVDNGKFDKRMGEYDLEELANIMVHSRDKMFEYMGLEICISRYLLEDMDSKLQLETPQMF